MLKGLSPLLTPDILWMVAAMGHGDDLVLADRNFPAASVAADTVTGKLVQLPNCDTTVAAEAILSLFPLDSFVEKPIRYMEVVGDPDAVLEVHRDLASVAEAAEGRAITMEPTERHAFYAAAREGFGVIQTTESRPYGCFILKKGVVFD